MYSFRNHSISEDGASHAEATTWHVEQPENVSVHIGFPNPAIDATRHELDLTQLLIKHQAGTYVMRIEGNDWTSCGIFDGDFALVDRVLAPRANDIVVWWYDGDFIIGPCSRMRSEATVWGVVTATVHRFVKDTQ